MIERDDMWATDDGPTRFGFRWGPMDVSRLCHVPGRGYSIEVRTQHGYMQIYVSEKGRVIRAYDHHTLQEAA